MSPEFGLRYYRRWVTLSRPVFKSAEPRRVMISDIIPLRMKNFAAGNCVSGQCL